LGVTLRRSESRENGKLISRNYAYVYNSSSLRLDQTVRSSFFWDWTRLRSQGARLYGPVFFTVSIFKQQKDRTIQFSLLFIGPDCGPNSLDHVVRSFGTVSKRDYSLDRTGLWPVYFQFLPHCAIVPSIVSGDT
jgi:hypothetical protein